MKCPNCHHEQTGKYECEACGIIFQKYLSRQEKNNEANAPATSDNKTSFSSSNQGKSMAAIWIVGIIGILLGVTSSYFFFAKHDQKPSQIIQHEITTEKSEIKQIKAPKKKRLPKINQSSSFGLAGQIESTYPAGNIIEKARNATVFIKAPWGSGSGFFIDDKCHIITNRHVVEYDHEKLASQKEQLADLKEFIYLEEKNIQDIRQYLHQNNNIQNRKYYEKALEAKQKQMDKAKSKHDEMASKLSTIEKSSSWSDIKVILIDGSEQYVSSVQISPNLDLALITIMGDNSPFLRPASSSLLQQGTKLLTIGNPMGLRHTVTAGIFSGYRKHKDNLYIQTDAPINPGNSGGPLIFENGAVVGVNTMIMQQTEGIGFAIPIESVFQEFILPGR